VSVFYLDSIPWVKRYFDEPGPGQGREVVRWRQATGELGFEGGTPPDLDWSAFPPLCEAHSVAPLVCSVLKASAADAIPRAALECLRDSFRQTAILSLTLSADLVKLLGVFQRESIEAILLKGPTLAETLYGNLALRAFADLDLLVHPWDLLRVKKTLEANGYHLRSTLHWPGDSACFRARECQLSFADSRNVSVDLHGGLLPDYFPAAFDIGHVWKKLREILVAGRKAPTLSAEQLVLFLCAHGTKHLWERLGWICDPGRLLQVEKSID
jgi:hypothetical protein